MDLWEKTLWECDKKTAKKLTLCIDDNKLLWGVICDRMEYREVAFDSDEYMTSHFRRVLVELKLLSVYGDHTFKKYHKEEINE